MLRHSIATMADSPLRPSSGHPQLASAVVIPDVLPQSASPPPIQPPLTNGHTTNPNLKRHASDIPDDEAEPDLRHDSEDPLTKRARLSSDLANGSPLAATPDSSEPSTRPRPTRPAAAAVTAEAERKRGKRLFGSLLGTLSQSTSPGAAQKRRADAERKQRDKLAALSSSASAPTQRQNDTSNGAAESEQIPGTRQRTAQELAALQRERCEQQRRWEDDEMRVRHASMRARARFLCTKAEPRICWLPYELLVDEEKVLDEQRVRVEEEIAKEEEDETRKRLHLEQEGDQDTDDPEGLAVGRSGNGATSESRPAAHDTFTTNADRGEAQDEPGQKGSDHDVVTTADNATDEHKDNGEDDDDIPLSRDAEEDPVLY